MLIKTDEKWLAKFNLLVEYKNKVNKKIILSTVYKGENIGIWLRTQRKTHKLGKLTMYRKKLLESAGVEFSYNKSLLMLEREKKKISRKELAATIGISEEVLKKYELRSRKLESANTKVIYKIMIALDCHYKEIIELDFDSIDKEIEEKRKLFMEEKLWKEKN